MKNKNSVSCEFYQALVDVSYFGLKKNAGSVAHKRSPNESQWLLVSAHCDEANSMFNNAVHETNNTLSDGPPKEGGDYRMLGPTQI